MHDEANIAQAAVAAGAAAIVLKSKLATDLLPAVDAVRGGRRYLSSELSDDDDRSK